MAPDYLERELPGFQRDRVVDVRRCHGDWPAQRACAGFDLPRRTPICGLYNVGDGVKPFDWSGAAACAESERLVVEEIRRDWPRPSTP